MTLPVGLDELVDDLAAEQLGLQGDVAGIDADRWCSPTPSWQWDVRDSIAHLADTDEMAVDTCLGGPRSINEFAAHFAGPDDAVLWGVLRGRRRTGAGVLAWWVEASAREREVLRGLDPAERVPWGIGMRATSFVSARLMETWAHGLDVRAALGIAAPDTDRLAHVAWLGLRALPYAYSVAGRASGPPPVRVEVTLPSGAPWSFGPEGAPDRVRGPAGELCRVLVQRLPADQAHGLVVEGDGAREALRLARAFL